MNVWTRILVPFIGLLVVACGTAGTDDGGTQPQEEDGATTTVGTTPPLDPPETVVTTTIATVSGEVPGEILEGILEDAAGRASVEIDALRVIRDQAVEWPDGSLGCPEPGQFYTQAIVSGYWVEIEGPDLTYDYRVSGEGNFKLCENEIMPPSKGGFVTPTTNGSDS